MKHTTNIHGVVYERPCIMASLPLPFHMCLLLKTETVISSSSSVDRWT